jgi:Rod binding domain-containing protein
MQIESIENIQKRSVGQKEEARLKELSSEFESLFLKQLLDVSMKDSSFAGKGAGKDIIMGMYTEQLANASSGSFGLSHQIYQYLSDQANIQKKAQFNNEETSNSKE